MRLSGVTANFMMRQGGASRSVKFSGTPDASIGSLKKSPSVKSISVTPTVIAKPVTTTDSVSGSMSMSSSMTLSTTPSASKPDVASKPAEMTYFPPLPSRTESVLSYIFPHKAKQQNERRNSQFQSIASQENLSWRG